MAENIVISESDSSENFQYLSIEDIESEKKQQIKQHGGNNKIDDPYYYKYIKYKIKYLELKHRIMNK